MAYFDVQMDGVRDYTLRLHLNQGAQDWGSNSSRVDWGLEAIGNYGSFGNYATNWSVSVHGETFSGSIGSFNPNPGQYIATGSKWVTHNWDGYLTIGGSGWWDSRHTNIGQGTASGQISLARIPKTPAQPAQPWLNNFTPTSVRVNGSAPDNMGLGIEEYQFAASPHDQSGQIFYNHNGSVLDVGGLTPGRTYNFQFRARNALGYGPWSPGVDATPGLPAPSLDSWIQNSTGSLVASWSAPSPATGLTGYRLQFAHDAGFTQNVTQLDVGNITSQAVGGLSGGRIHWVRVAARTAGGVNAYSASRSQMLVLDSGDLNGWARIGSKPAAVSYFTSSGIRRGTVGTNQALHVESLSTGAATLTADTFGIQRTFTGLTVGRAYRIEANGILTAGTSADLYRLVAPGITGSAVTLNTSTATALPAVEFVATATSHVVSIRLAETVTLGGATDIVERAAFTGIKLSQLATDFPQRLRNTVYESNLANHFDLACNSVGATWYVSKDGVTRFRLPGTALPISAVFSDEDDPNSVSYVDLVPVWDTRSTINRIEAVNYGVDIEGVNEENDELIVEDLASQNTYGVYRTPLNLNLYDEAPYDASFQNRLAELIDAHNEPERLISSIRWNAQEDIQLAKTLEIGQRITVRYRGIAQDSQIVSINHDLTPTRWIITLNLRSL